MADSERRYGPTIDLQGFDLASNLGTNMDTVDEPSRLPLVVLIALVVLAAFAGVVWLAYTQGVERGRESVSRELTAQEFWKVRKPAQPAYTGLKIYEPASAADQNPHANAAASPKPKVATTIPALRPTASVAPDTLLQPSASSPAATSSQTIVAGSSAKPAAVPSAAQETKPEAQRVATRAPTQLTKPEAPPMPTHPLTEPDSLSPASTSTPPASAAHPSAPAVKPPALAVPKSTVSAPPVTTSVPAPAAASTQASGIVLQIGSYKSDAEARQSWQSFKSDHDAAADYHPDVKQVDLGAKGTWYRLRMGPFPDKKTALETCRKLKADGASCLLAQ